jgi:hypothetical protein
MVAGVPGKPAEVRMRLAPLSRADRGGETARGPSRDQGDRRRGRARHALHRRHAPPLCKARLPRRPFRLDDGRGQSRPRSTSGSDWRSASPARCPSQSSTGPASPFAPLPARPPAPSPGTGSASATRPCSPTSRPRHGCSCRRRMCRSPRAPCARGANLRPRLETVTCSPLSSFLMPAVPSAEIGREQDAVHRTSE